MGQSGEATYGVQGTEMVSRVSRRIAFTARCLARGLTTLSVILLLVVGLVIAAGIYRAHAWYRAADSRFRFAEALNRAAFRGDYERCRSLLAAGAPVAACSPPFPRPADTVPAPLEAAVCSGNVALVRLLLNSGADPNSTSGSASSPDRPALAAAHGGSNSTELVDLLLSRGATLEGTDGSERTALWWAVDARDPTIVRYLLRLGARQTDRARSWALERRRACEEYRGHKADRVLGEWNEICRLLGAR
jgi:hypothetical protein